MNFTDVGSLLAFQWHVKSYFQSRPEQNHQQDLSISSTFFSQIGRFIGRRNWWRSTAIYLYLACLLDIQQGQLPTIIKYIIKKNNQLKLILFTYQFKCQKFVCKWLYYVGYFVFSHDKMRMRTTFPVTLFFGFVNTICRSLYLCVISFLIM